ncbi:hypothetical protein [Reichenbachiella sp. MALMAid0571]|uniref:hypothetical protein n=1 Tax=Reichenbachiella sp. MALMAid0571 TaxID=3143939 RepID=UPI0032DF4E8A
MLITFVFRFTSYHPNDNPVPPNQVSGDGIDWNDGIVNFAHPINYLTGKNKAL